MVDLKAVVDFEVEVVGANEVVVEDGGQGVAKVDVAREYAVVGKAVGKAHFEVRGGSDVDGNVDGEVEVEAVC